ncbi:PHA/PHB synthase family protein [Ahrensia kielensis]|uniref:PHA/PHB synthase family protein n=1 Tax=Ahrensia kielensis TaxID=76980 RepID=UPI00036168C7|nr:class I poly(R)-hydroxyalkanoic acid synthase [Ahrensia kielensis]
MSEKGQKSENTSDDTKQHFALEPYVVKNPDEFSKNLAKMIEAAGQAASEWLKPREEGSIEETSDSTSELTNTFSKLTEYWLSDPQRAIEAQTKLFSGFMGVWSNSIQRLNDSTVPEAVDASHDKRFKDEDWSNQPFFSFLKQTYLVTSQWAEDLVADSELDPHTKHKAEFYVKQVTGALSPSNFMISNPEVFKETIATNGANLVEGMKMLADDIRDGKGDLKLRQVDGSKFVVGENLATTPGKVIARSDLIELIQYTPTTDKVLKRPLLICPPWINKFYILDLNPEKSFIKWAVDQGHTVFVMAWVNPDERHKNMDWTDYIHEGLFFALDNIEKATGEKQVNAIGYCVGGTLLATALGYMAQIGDTRIATSTFFTTQVDFTHAGDLKVFVDEEQLSKLEEQMHKKGYLEGSKMATAFNMLRAGDMIWPYMVNNYMRGKAPTPFDLLYWNSDATRMACTNHLFYLRNCYYENRLSQGTMRIGGKQVDLSKVTIPIYNLAAKEDHIAPALSVFEGSKFFGGDVTYVMGGSGHIAGVVNPPAKKKYQFWTGGKVEGDFAKWVDKAEETAGSWWDHWNTWIRTQDDTEVAARKKHGGNKLKPLCDAPGTYVKVRS